jgi:adenylate cyclase class 2
MEEIEIVVSDFEKTADLLLALGFVGKIYEENKRIRYAKGTVEFDIDIWPMIPPYLEIEARSWSMIDRSAKMLGLDPAQKKIFSTHQVYRLYGIEEDEYAHIGFKKCIKK